MSDFSVVGGVIRIHSAELFSTWQDRADYIDALIASPDPEASAVKRDMMDYQVSVARTIHAGRVSEDLDGILVRRVAEDIVEHGPNMAPGRAALARYFRAGATGRVPAPPIALIAEGDLITVVKQALDPDPEDPSRPYERYIVVVFRMRDGKFVEHWTPAGKGESPAAGHDPDFALHKRFEEIRAHSPA